MRRRETCAALFEGRFRRNLRACFTKQKFRCSAMFNLPVISSSPSLKWRTKAWLLTSCLVRFFNKAPQPLGVMFVFSNIVLHIRTSRGPNLCKQSISFCDIITDLRGEPLWLRSFLDSFLLLRYQLSTKVVFHGASLNSTVCTFLRVQPF